MKNPYRPRLAALLLAQIALTTSTYAGTTWDAGGGADTNINTAANWDADTLPDFTGPSTLTFGVANSTATINVPVEVVRASITNSFTLAAGDGTLTVRGTNSGANAYGIQATSAAASVVIDEPVLVKASATAAPLGNLFLLYNNRTTANTTTVRINGGISLAPSSTVTSYILRYGTNTSLSANTSDTRIAGPITGMSTLQNSSGNGNWAGDLIIAGDQAGLSTTDIVISSSGFLAPTATARLVLGETKDDDQTWRNVNLSNVMNLAVGGNITIGTLTTSSNTTLGTKITGIAADLASAGTLTIGNGTVNIGCPIGGAGANENNLHLTKSGIGALTINGNHTYLGNTTVATGTLTLSGNIASPVTVNAGATIAGEGSTTGSLAFGPGSSTLNFDPATPAALSAGSLSAGGGTVVVSPGSAVADGIAYPVLKLTGGTFSGNASDKFVLGSRGGLLSYTNSNTELTLTGGAATAASLVWTGANATNPTFWDVAGTANWSNVGSADRYFSGDNVIFDDTAASTTVSIQTASVSPASIVFNNTSAKNYTLSGGIITGSTGLTKSGNGTLVLATTGTSTYSGGLVLNDGVLEFSALAQLGSASAPSIQVNGGTLRFNSLATSTGGPGITFNAPATFDVSSNSTITIRLAGKLSGSGDITKTGTGIMALGNSNDTDPGNDFTGALTVNGGILDIRALNSLGATSAGTTVSNAILMIQNFGQLAGTKTFSAEPLTFSGNAFVTAYAQQNMLFVNQLSGPVTVSSGAVLGLSSARSASGITSPQLELTGPSVTTSTGSTLSFGLRPAAYPAGFLEDYQMVSVSGPITGPAAVVAQGTALSLYTLSAPGYSGDTTVLGGTLRLNADNTANNASTVSVASTGASLELNFSGTDTVARLFVGSTQLDAGTYKAVGNSGATGTELAQITGSGTLTVTTGPVVLTPFESWAAGFGLTGNAALAASDPDSDGLSNVLEYATGTSPVASGQANVTVARSGDSLSLTYTRVADASLTYTVEGSSDLTGAWSTIAVNGNPSTGAANVAGNVTVTDTVSLTTAPKRFLRLRVSY